MPESAGNDALTVCRLLLMRLARPPGTSGGVRRAVARACPTLVAAGLGLALVIGKPTWTSAHEIPADVTVLAFVRPEGSLLRVLVRVPLESMRDVEFPTRGPGYLEIEAARPLLREAVQLWIADYVELYEGDTRLGEGRIAATRISLPSDRSFGSYEDALAHVSGAALPAGTDLIWQQALLDVLLEYPITSDRSRFSMRAGLAHLGVRTMTVLRFLPPGGAERVYQYVGDPGLVRLDPRWHQAALRFVRLGFLHILDGLDHLLFVLCLVIPFRRIRPLVAIVTSFTVAHSITLIASATGLAPGALWFPALIEMLIAASIVWMALENIVGARLQRRWLFAFGFGLVHGFGFSFVLRDTLQFAGSHLATSLFAFNVGVELGQIFVLLLTIPALEWLLRKAVAEKVGTIILSALVAHTAWHWLTARLAVLRQFEFRWPAANAMLLASLMRGLMLLLTVVGAAWLMYGLIGRIVPRRGEAGAAASPEG